MDIVSTWALQEDPIQLKEDHLQDVKVLLLKDLLLLLKGEAVVEWEDKVNAIEYTVYCFSVVSKSELF